MLFICLIERKRPGEKDPSCVGTRETAQRELRKILQPQNIRLQNGGIHRGRCRKMPGKHGYPAHHSEGALLNLAYLFLRHMFACSKGVAVSTGGRKTPFKGREPTVAICLGVKGPPFFGCGDAGYDAGRDTNLKDVSVSKQSPKNSKNAWF